MGCSIEDGWIDTSFLSLLSLLSLPLPLSLSLTNERLAEAATAAVVKKRGEKSTRKLERERRKKRERKDEERWQRCCVRIVSGPVDPVIVADVV